MKKRLAPQRDCTLLAQIKKDLPQRDDQGLVVTVIRDLDTPRAEPRLKTIIREKLLGVDVVSLGRLRLGYGEGVFVTLLGNLHHE